MSKVTLGPSGQVIDVDAAKPLMQQLKEAGKNIKSSCGGCATCGDCVIIIKAGEENLSPMTFEEKRLLGSVFHITKERLSCQVQALGPVTIDISAHEKKKSLKVEAAVSKGTGVVVRKKEDLQETASKSQENIKEKKEDDWYRHWDKKDEKDASKVPPKQGGGKRPKAFQVKDDDRDPQDKK